MKNKRHTPLRVQVLKHMNFELPNNIDTWAQKRKYHLAVSRTHLDDILPAIEDIDLLLVMGGPQTLRKLGRYPYLQRELDYIQQAIAAKKHILGVCLGTQLIAMALGAEVVKSPDSEFGKHTVTLNAAGRKDAVFQHFPDAFNAVQWHDDMSSLIHPAEVLAHSDACPNQVIRFAPRVYGIQFHLEATTEYAQRLLPMIAHAKRKDKVIQILDEISEQDANNLKTLMYQLLDRLVEQ